MQTNDRTQNRNIQRTAHFSRVYEWSAPQHIPTNFPFLTSGSPATPLISCLPWF